jgi:DNA-directed RNA polymerase subunit RPC12/RpoP
MHQDYRCSGCGHCNIKRFYKPLELREVIGNVTIDQVRAKVRCEKCKSKESMNASILSGRNWRASVSGAWSRSGGSAG